MGPVCDCYKVGSPSLELTQMHIILSLPSKRSDRVVVVANVN